MRLSAVDAVTHGEASQLGNIGLTYHDRGEPDEALKYLQQEPHVFEFIGAETLISQTKNMICDIQKNVLLR